MDEIRRAGLVRMLVWGAIASTFGVFAHWLTRHGWQIVGYGWGIPGAVALGGLVQFVSGISFIELSSKWNSLAGWQRGVLGILIVLACFALLLGCVVAFAA
jgi:hypothetical protein